MLQIYFTAFNRKIRPDFINPEYDWPFYISQLTAQMNIAHILKWI